MSALARRALACPGWRWMPGMRAMVTSEGYGPVPASPDRLDDLEAEAYKAGGAGGQWPDLSDPATVGCLLALVREAWGEPAAAWYPKSTETCCVGVGRMPIASGRFWKRRTYAEALVAALEAAGGGE